MSALTDWLTAIADAIREKDGTTDPIDHADFPDRIEAIPQDSSGGEEGPWRPSDWPDIEAIVDADVQAGYTYKYIYLIADDYSYVDLSGGIAYKTSDGAFYTSSTQHVWDTSKDFPCSEGYKTRWVIVYTASENRTAFTPYEVLWVDSGSVKFGSSGFSTKRLLRGVTGEFQQLTTVSSMFNSCYSITKVPDVLDLSQCTNTSYMFNNCRSLTKVPDVLDLSQCTNTANMFNSCYSLTKVPNVLDLSQCTNTANMFYACYSLTKVPDVLDLSQCTNTSYMFNTCHSLTKVPDVLDLSQCTNTSYMFSNCNSLTKVPDMLDLSQCTNASYMFNNCNSLTKVPDVLDLSQCTNTANMFYACNSLTKVPDVLDLSQCTNTASMFNSCYSLTKVPDMLDLSQCTNASNMFNNCYSLTKVPDVLDLSQCTSVSSMFNNCLSLLKTPQLIVSPTSAAGITFSFSSCTRINADHRDSVAEFTGGTLTGGMVYHLPTVTNARTLTLNSMIKGLFTTTEQSDIAAHLTGKKWSLSW